MRDQIYAKPGSRFPGRAKPQTPVNSAIRYPVTVGWNISAPALIAERDISEVVSCIRGGRFERTDLRAEIEVIRNLHCAELAQAMKKRLPWFCGSLCEKRRSNATVRIARFAIFDLDHVADIEGLKAAAIAKLPFVRYAFRSVRDGVKLIAQFDRPVTDEEDFRLLWRYLASQVRSALKHEVDSTPDWARACFFSYDPGLLDGLGQGFRPLEVPTALMGAEFVLAIERRGGAEARRDAGPGVANSALPQGSQSPSNDASDSVRSPNRNSASQPHSEDTFEKARLIVQKLATQVIPYADWYRAGMALYAGFGEAGRELWDLFLDNPHYADTQREMDKQWRSFARVRTISLETLFWLGGKYGCQE